MSLEARITRVEHKVEHLEHAFHENNKILEATHGVVSMILTEQQEIKKRLIQLDEKIDQTEARLGNKIDQVELLIRQRLPEH